MTDPTKILIRMPNWLGDLMMATAFCQAVLERFPEATVDLIVRRALKGYRCLIGELSCLLTLHPVCTSCCKSQEGLSISSYV